MAGVVDILLRLVGDSRDAVRAVDQVGEAADRSTTRVGRLSQSLTSMASRAVAIGGAVVASVEGFQQVYGQLDQLFNPNPQENVAAAVGAQDTARRLLSASGLRFTDLADPRNLTRRGTLFGGRAAGPESRVKAAIDALAQSNPGQLAAALPFLDGFYRDYATEQLRRQEGAAAFQESLKTSAGVTGSAQRSPTVVNVYTGVGDRNAIGRHVRSTLDARDRNNGRYVQTNTRR